VPKLVTQTSKILVVLRQPTTHMKKQRPQILRGTLWDPWGPPSGYLNIQMNAQEE
jgi:hypothetical protein